MTGIYFYADFCSGKIWGLKRSGDGWENRLLLDSDAEVTAFGEDERGELYLVDRRGILYRVQAPK